MTGFRWEFECKNRESRPDGIFGKDSHCRSKSLERKRPHDPSLANLPLSV